MSRFWKRQQTREIEEQLRALRPQLSRDSLDRLVRRARENDPRPDLRLRVALSLAISVILFASLAAFGGLSYAASGAKHAWQVMGQNGNSNSFAWRGRGDRKHDYRPPDDTYEDDHECEIREQALRAHQEQEHDALSAHQTSGNHPNFTSSQRNKHYRRESKVLRKHQKDEWKEFDYYCDDEGEEEEEQDDDDD